VYEQGADWKLTVAQLQAAIQEHVLRMANTTAAMTVIKPDVARERRQN
jgi:hypothetical protein